MNMAPPDENEEISSDEAIEESNQGQQAKENAQTQAKAPMARSASDPNIVNKST